MIPPPAAPLILVLVADLTYRQQLQALLTPKYAPTLGADASALNHPFDLCILDGPRLTALEDRILVRKSEDPPFLPFLLVTSREELPALAGHIQFTVDEILLTPIEDLILKPRVETLLNTRRLVKEVQLLADFDELTGALTRRRFFRMAQREFARARRFQRQRLGRDLLLGVGFIVLFIILAVGGGITAGILIYGATPAPATMVPLPLWGALYSLIVWPIIWAFAEEMTYQGYSLPRLEVISGRAWLAVLIVGFGWALQHSALPLMSDWRWALYRFGSSLLIGIVLPIIYLRTRRLLPFILAHWAANFVSVLMTVVLPMMTI